MDPLRACLALGPVAVYMFVLGMVNLSRRPLVVSGVRDVGALGLAVFGLILVGPLELFVPGAAVLRYGMYIWPLLAGFYGMCLILVLLTMRPRLIVYNASAEQLRPILAALAARLDPNACWAGDSLSLPCLGVELHFESSAWMRNVSLVASGGHQNDLGWMKLGRELSAAMAGVELGRNPRGLSLLSAGSLIAAWLAINAARNPQAIGEALRDMLQF
ncbi:MAG: hypothetical protein U1E05_05430 [Patescibacteria group bacterium]|nr:hypothetical protein [Patescibacteria group bacterium]